MEPGHEQGDEFGLGYPVSSAVGERIRGILSEAEAAAAAMRHDADQYAHRRRRIAEEEANHLIETARREADDLMRERVQRISDLSDTLVNRAEGLLGRLDQAERMRSQLADLAEALGHSAEQLAHEIDVEAHGAAHEPRQTADPAPQGVAEPEREPEPEPDEDEEPPVDVIVEPEPRDLRAVPNEPEDAIVEETNGDRADDQLAARLVALQMAVAGGNRAEVEGHLRRAFELESPDAILDDVFGAGTGPATRVSWPEATEH